MSSKINFLVQRRWNNEGWDLGFFFCGCSAKRKVSGGGRGGGGEGGSSAKKRQEFKQVEEPEQVLLQSGLGNKEAEAKKSQGQEESACEPAAGRKVTCEFIMSQAMARDFCVLEKAAGWGEGRDFFFFFFFFLAFPMACRNSWAREQIHTTAVTTLDP